jgi:hypothetical protein
LVTHSAERAGGTGLYSFSSRELIARIKAVLRRGGPLRAGPDPSARAKRWSSSGAGAAGIA